MTFRAHLVVVSLAAFGCADGAGVAAGGSSAPASSELSAPPPSSSPASSTPSAALAPDEPERWIGRVDVPNAPQLVVALKFRSDTPDAATLAIPSQGLPPTALKDVALRPGSLDFTLPLPGRGPGVSAVFSARREPGAAVATGTLVQEGFTMKLTLRRLAPDESLTQAMYPQTPRPPFSYAEREASYESRDGTKLAGTLTLPKAATKLPAVLLITGTGEQDRDETLSGHKPFWVLADHLTKAGIAVLRVDDRGVGGSSGDTGKTGFDGKVEDALAGMSWLASQPEIDPTQIGLLGHSEGGLLAPLVAVRARAPAPAVAFLVLLASPGVPGVALLTKQMRDTLIAQGASPERVAIGDRGQKKVLDAVVAGADDDTMRAIVEEQVDAILALSPGEKPGLLQRRAMVEHTMLQVASPAMRDFIRSNPAPVLEKVTCPVLALGGGRDLQVPGEENLAAIEAALLRGKNPDVTTRLFPGHNHLFQPAVLGTPEEWAGIETTLDPAVLDEIAAWLGARTR